MATITHVQTNGNQGSQYFWETMTGTDDTGSAIEVNGRKVCVQVTGTFNSTTIVWQGSNDGTNFATLENPNGDALSATAAALWDVEPRPRYMRPYISASGGSDDLDVTCWVVD